MSDKTRRAEVRVLEIEDEDEMVKLSVDGEREDWFSPGDVLLVEVPGEPSRALARLVQAALGRAMTLLRRVWDESGEGTDIVRSRTNANHWSDVVRWISDSPEVDELHAAQQAQFDQTGRTIKPEVPAPPSRREAMTNYRPVSRVEAGKSWSPHDNITSQCGFDWGGADVSCEPAWFAYNHTRQEFTIGSWGEDGDDTTPERWSGWSDEELDKLAEMLSHGGHELADLQAERRRRHEASSDGLAYKLRDMAENLSADLGPSEDDREALREAARLLEVEGSGREKKP